MPPRHDTGRNISQAPARQPFACVDVSLHQDLLTFNFILPLLSVYIAFLRCPQSVIFLQYHHILHYQHNSSSTIVIVQRLYRTFVLIFPSILFFILYSP